ncbi:hypothetical protein M1512_02625 [Patescibacteria group bacterium]|jgi:hypothetical protein|nr:hypothetical protein [Patescibacteria group bacterium]
MSEDQFTKLSKYIEEDIDRVTRQLNTRPPERHHYQTHDEVFRSKKYLLFVVLIQDISSTSQKDTL